MDAPGLSAADVRETLHADPADGVSDVGLQESPIRAGVWRMVMVPPFTDVGMAVPVASADEPLVS
jgi:hypothetical protein